MIIWDFFSGCKCNQYVWELYKETSGNFCHGSSSWCPQITLKESDIWTSPPAFQIWWSVNIIFICVIWMVTCRKGSMCHIQSQQKMRWKVSFMQIMYHNSSKFWDTTFIYISKWSLKCIIFYFQNALVILIGTINHSLTAMRVLHSTPEHRGHVKLALYAIKWFLQEVAHWTLSMWHHLFMCLSGDGGLKMISYFLYYI